MAALVVLVAGCSGSAEDDEAVDPPAEPVDELTLHDGQFCPETLPRAPQETSGFGTDEPATELPAFPAFDEAWLCTYQSEDVAPRGSNGAVYDWVRTEEPVRLDPDRSASFVDSLDDLELLGDGERMCTADLGPRYLVSLSWERDLTGVVLDDYGCREVRLTGDPFVTVPGDASQPGTVAGVLGSPDGLLAGLGVGRGR